MERKTKKRRSCRTATAMICNAIASDSDHHCNLRRCVAQAALSQHGRHVVTFIDVGHCCCSSQIHRDSALSASGQLPHSPDAMTDVFDPAMALFQIGEDKYGYKYRSSNMKANGSVVYQCIRATDNNAHADCLWLYKSHDGHWIATEAPKTCTDPVNQGQPKFRTCEVEHDIREPKWLQWSWFDTVRHTWKEKMGFQTYTIMPALPPPVALAMMGDQPDLPRNPAAAAASEDATPATGEPIQADVPTSGETIQADVAAIGEPTPANGEPIQAEVAVAHE